MKNEILTHINNPESLERLYREDQNAFRQAFTELMPVIPNNDLVRFWRARLNFGRDLPRARRDLVFLLIAALLAGVIARLPDLFNIDSDFFYIRNTGFILFPALTAYFAWKNRMSADKIAFLAGATLAGLIFINTLFPVNGSDTLELSGIHLPLFLWTLLGIAFTGGSGNAHRRPAFLKYNGDLAVMTALIVIAGAILSGVTIGLFSLIGYRIEEFYMENIVVFSLPAAPILGTWLVRTSPQLVGRVSPVIARIFSPLVLAMLVIYLAAMIYSGRDPYNDREFLLVFNILLIGVMAIIFFSVTEATGSNSTEIWILFLLSIVTIVVNGIALSAIVFRISEWGITPNRAAVLGGNIVILGNLLLVAANFIRVIRKKDIEPVRNAIARYLPAYFFWTFVVTFIFPLIFGFK